MITEPDEILDDLFHGCALAAFVEQAVADRGWPAPETTRVQAFCLYEEALTDRNRQRVEIDNADRPAIRCSHQLGPL